MLVFFRLTALLLCLIHGTLTYAIESDDDTPQTTATKTTADDHTPLTLNENSLRLSGIQTLRLQAVGQRDELLAQGHVLSLEPLLALRQQYLSASAIQDGARAKYQESDSNLARTRELYRQDIVSNRRLQEQQALWQGEKANLANSAYQQQAIVTSSLWQWGRRLTDWFLLGQGNQAARFIERRSQLLLITLPANAPTNHDMGVAFIDGHGRRAQALKAELIERAPQVDPMTQGVRYFFELKGSMLALGAPVTAWVDHQGETQQGVILPDSALLWHLGQACVFVKNDQGRFVRRVLHDFQPSAGGYFVKGDLYPGDEVVITGSQTLLSQALKHQIPSEDDD